MDRFPLGILVAKIKNIISFGDSFIYGSEVPHNEDGSLAWPGLIATQLGCEYKTFAVPGCANEAIARQVFSYFSADNTQDVLAVINWTWCMRWDFYLHALDEYIGLGPTCVPEKLQEMLNQTESKDLIGFYKTYLQDSHSWNQYRSLQAIVATQYFFKTNNIKNIQTYMDRELFMPPVAPSRLEHYLAYKDAAWPDIIDESQLQTLPLSIRSEVDHDYDNMADPNYIHALQKIVWPEMQDFDGQTFLEWSRSNGFAVTPPPHDHPLTQAHQAAADFWLPKYQQALL